MKIAIGTLNKAKNEAVKQIFSLAFGRDLEFVSFKTNSGISEQPMSDEECIEGAINRAKEALRLGDADFGVGLEGGVDENKFGMFLVGWVAIVDKDGNIGIGSSSKILMPEFLAKELKSGKELGPLIQELMKDDKNEIRHSSGTNGILTKGLYTRLDEFKDAVKTALARLINRNFYERKSL